MIRFRCTGCGLAYSVPDSQAGRGGQCRDCQAEFLIPAADPDPEAGAVPLPPDDAPAPSKTSSGGALAALPCPQCRGQFSLVPRDIGERITCPHCRAEFVAEPADPASVPLTPRRGRDWGDDRPPPRRRRRYDYEDEDSGRKPGGVHTVGALLLGGAVYSLVHIPGGVLLSGCCLLVWPPVYLQLGWAVWALVRALPMVGAQPDRQGAPRALAICQICCILNFDLVNCILGIVALSMLNDREVARYYDRDELDE